MALLGNGGILELSREWPEPMALAPEAINYQGLAVRGTQAPRPTKALSTSAFLPI
jgi:hypothetical protein